MSAPALSQMAVDVEQEIVFHPDFSTKHQGDLIVRSEKDNKSFYFAHSLLSALSSFFATLPNSTAPSDNYNGCPIIPLDTTSAALELFFNALLSTQQPEPFAMKRWYTPSAGAAVIDAAVLAATFQCPIIFRLLGEAVQHAGYLDHFYPYAIWVIAGVHTKVEEAAVVSLHSQIAYANEYLVQTMKARAPAAWMRLLEFHLRRIQGLEEFHLSRRPHEEDYPQWGHEGCSHKSGDRDDRIAEVLAKAKSVEAIMEVRQDNYGLPCSGCYEVAEQWYGPHVDRLVKLAYRY